MKDEYLQLNISLQNLSRDQGFWRSYGKTPKIIFVVFFITFSPCVFWSQHASPLLLSLFNRWLKHTEGKSVLALARSNITMREDLIFWMNFFTWLYLGHLMLCCSSLLLSTILSHSSCRNICHTCTPSLQMCCALCMWTLEHHRATAET